MTLVVARHFGNCLWIAADTKISDPRHNLREREHELKLFSLPGGAMAAYAGSPEKAHEVFREVALRSTDASVDQIANHAHRLVAGTEVHFLVAHRGRLFVSKYDELSRDAPHGWIGDQPAFSTFQRHLFDARTGRASSASTVWDGAILRIVDTNTVGEPSQGGANFGLDMHAALLLVAGDLNHDAVGGEIVLACSTGTKTAYVSFSNFVSPPFQAKQNGRWNTVDFGHAANGGYSFTTVVPTHLVYPSFWAVFRHQAGEGRLFISDPARSRFLVSSKRASSAAHYCAILNDAHGIEFTHCGSHRH